MRQTFYSFEQICAVLAGELPLLPGQKTCMFISELGAMAREENDERAARKLVEFLHESKPRSERYVAYHNLKKLKSDNVRIQAALQTFEGNPANAGLLIQ